MNRGNRVFQKILPLVNKKCCIGATNGPPEANDIFLHALFARLTLNNNETIEFETRYNPNTNTIELYIPPEAKNVLNQITGIQRGPTFKTFIDWLIGSQTLIPPTKIDGEFVPSSNLDIWFGGKQVMMDNKLTIALPNTDQAIIGHNLKTGTGLTAQSRMLVYLNWVFQCGSGNSFTVRTTSRINYPDGVVADASVDTNVSTFNLIAGDIRESLVLDTGPEVDPGCIVNILINRNFPGSPEPHTETIGLVGLRIRFQ